jgi:hypothetical protein
MQRSNEPRFGATPPSKAKPLVDVIATEYHIGPEQDYLYLRVDPDHIVEAQIVNRKHLFDRAVIANVKKRLTPEQYGAVQSAINDPGVFKLDPLYRQRLGGVLDDFTSWKIQLRTAGKPKEIQLVAFTPDEARKRNRPYPEALLKLGCTIEQIRSEVTGENAELDDECLRVLKAKSRDSSKEGTEKTPVETRYSLTGAVE